MASKTTTISTPREFLSACRDLVGDNWMIKLFRVGPRTIQRWVAQRPYVDEASVRENYLEKHEQMIEKLLRTPGGCDVARAIVARHADLVGCDLVSREAIFPDKENIDDEMLDDYPALVKLHAAMRDGDDLDTVGALLSLTKRELDETFIQYRGGAS